MSATCLPKIVDEILEGISSRLRVVCQRLASHTRRDLVNLLVLKCFPQVVRNVEHDALGKKFHLREKMVEHTWRKRTKGTH